MKVIVCFYDEKFSYMNICSCLTLESILYFYKNAMNVCV